MSKRYIAGIIVSIAALVLFFVQVPIGDMLSVLGDMDPLFLFLSAVTYILSYLVRAVRWQILLQPLGKTPFFSTLSALIIGFMGNNLLPARLGEFIRAFMLKKDRGYGVSASMASIVLERVFDGLTALLFLVVVLMFMPLPESSANSFITMDMLQKAAWGAGILFGGLLVVLQAFWWKRDWSIDMVKKIISPLPDKITLPLTGMIEGFTKGLSLVNLSSLIAVGVTSILTWTLISLFTWFLFPACGIKLDFMAAMLVQVILLLAMLIPAAPGAIGTFHLAAANILMFLGVKEGMAGSIAMTIWLIHYVLTNLAGLYFIWKSGLGFKALSLKGQEQN